MKRKSRLLIHIPNAITSINLAVGCLAANEALHGRLDRAALYILLCAVLDFMDGFAARILGAYSELGKQLDSLADLVSFGVAPAAIASSLLASGLKAAGWDDGMPSAAWSAILPLLIPVFSAIRLGRFNLGERAGSHFSGMPVPADAVSFAALAFIASGGVSRVGAVILHPVSVSALILLNSWLMIAPMAMFSFKLKSYRPSANPWRYLFATVSILLIALFRGYGLLAAFVLYIVSSAVMNFCIEDSEKAEAESESPAPVDAG